MSAALAVVAVLGVLVLILLAAAIRILREYERGVIFRLGRLIAQKGPGLIVLIPIIDQMVRVDLRTVTLNVPPQEVITKDNVTVRVNAVAYFRVVDPNKAITDVENYLLATSQIAQTTLRSVLGKAELDELLAERERLNVELQQIIDEQTEPWGVKVTTVEVKDVELPQEMQRVIARQAEAERERRAKVIAADGEFQAAEKLGEAANIMSRNPATLQLRYLQTLLEMGVNQNTTIVFPLPIDLLKAFVPQQRARDDRPGAGPAAATEPDLTAPEIRIDQLTGLRVVLAPGRAERPDAFAPAAAESKPDAMRPARSARAARIALHPRSGRTVPAAGAADTPGWHTRSVPNLYPVVGAVPEDPGGAAVAETGISSSADPLADSRRSAEPGLFGSQPAAGLHEVIVSTPRHETSLIGLSGEELAVMVKAWRERLRAAGTTTSYAHLIVNEGPQAGASLEHSHAQLYGLGFVPAEVARERERTAAYHQRTMGSHLLGDVVAEEVRRRDRLVAIDDEAALICPWASRSPFELRIVPRSPAAVFEAEDQGGAAMLGTALRALAGVFGSLPQLNLWVRTAPRGIEEFCWHIDILPRLTVRAGFELGTGVEINSYAPERAAGDLREALG